MINDNIPNKINELEKMLDTAINHIHDCESYNGGHSGYHARILIRQVQEKLCELKKELKDD